MKGPNFRLAPGILLHLCDNVASSYINILWISFVSRPSLKDGERQFRPGLSKMEHRISVGIFQPKLLGYILFRSSLNVTHFISIKVLKRYATFLLERCP